MSKEYYTENLSTETLAKLTDEMLRFEKSKKSKGVKINMNTIWKLTPLVAAFVLVIGLVYNTSIFSNINMDKIAPAANITEKNTIESTTINLNADGTMKDDSDSSVDVATSADEAIIQIGDLKITLSKEQELTENDDGTSTLPGNCLILLSSGTEITTLSRTIINSTGTEITFIEGGDVEDSGGHTSYVHSGDVMTNYGSILGNLPTDFNIDDYGDDYVDLDNEITNGLIGNFTYTSYPKGDNHIYKINDGTIIITASYSLSTMNDGNNGNMIFEEKCTIELTNGVKINAPADTIFEFENDTYTITVGGDATITQPDDTTSTVPAGIVLDSEGNVIK